MLKVTLISHTINPELIVAASAKLCYSQKADINTLMDDLTPEKVSEFVEKLEALGHESPFEHASYSFAVEGISKALSHQLVRSRLASFSQRSQRFCSEDDFKVIVPESIKKHEIAFNKFNEIIAEIRSAYQFLQSCGIPNEDARSLLPNACETRLIVSMNTRELWHFFNLRCCTRSQLEIRTLANKMLAILKNESPLLFKHAGASCVKGFCPEGRMSCGKAPTLDELLEHYKKNK